MRKDNKRRCGRRDGLRNRPLLCFGTAVGSPGVQVSLEMKKTAENEAGSRSVEQKQLLGHELATALR